MDLNEVRLVSYICHNTHTHTEENLSSPPNMKNSHTHLWIELRRLLATGSNTRKTNMVNCIQEQGVAAADLSHCLLRKTDGEWADLQTITAMRSLQTDQRDSGGACCSDSYIYRCGLITCPGKIALSQKRFHRSALTLSLRGRSRGSVG